MPPSKRPRILLLIPHLGGGGSERVIETLARSLDRGKYDVHLALITASHCSNQDSSLTIPVYSLGATRVRRSAVRLLRLIWKLRPNLILSGIAHLNLLVLALKPLLPRGTRILARQNGALAETLRPHPRRLSRRMYSVAYRRADRVICQTEAMAHELHVDLRVEPTSLAVLPNPTDISYIRRRTRLLNPQQTLGSPTLIAIGRLVPEKGFDLLLDALAALPPPHHCIELFLVGTGPQQCTLERQARELGIHSRTHFVGQMPDPIIQFPHASLFVLSSRTEGLPNAMLEAAAAGLPIVATPASAGLVDLLRNREGAWLASEISSEALRVILQQALTVVGSGRRYPHHWVEPYELSRAVAAYESVIDRVIAGAKP
jgi:glycosyltransferase involved in cell wall biosynthesis